MSNVFSVDVEDYFQVEAFSRVIDRATWENYAPRVEANTRKILELLAQREVRGTFFVLGWVAQRFPALVREISALGHEVASHGMSHQLIYRQTPEVFRRETHDSKRLLEDIVQQPVVGYRAATYSITAKSLWALDVLAEEGFRYDSSIFPMRHDRYGIPDANPIPHRMATPGGLSLVEFPISVLRYGSVKIPVAGGGYFRLFPYWFTHWALSRINSEKRDFVFYIHPWEVDKLQPRVAAASRLSKFRHYINLDQCAARLDRLVKDFSFTTMHESLREQGFF
jgi:polysaccharide deacetylase family protein (PEP-CTERM system associated)